MTTQMQEFQRFLAENVPHRCSQTSAMIEFAAQCRGLETDRYDKRILLVTFPEATVPFVGLNGPDTSRIGHLLCTYADEQRQLWKKQGLRTARYGVFATSQPTRAERFAANLGWPVTVRPARFDGADGVTTHVRSAEEFRAAWQHARDAYVDHVGTKRILVEQRPAGEALSFYVVSGRVVAATHRPSPEVAVDVTEEVDPRLATVAIDAVDALPGLVHAEVTLIAPPPAVGSAAAGPGSDPAADAAEVPEDEPFYVLYGVDCLQAPAGQFPTEGQPRDIGGAIIDHYLSAPRWRIPRTIPHQPITAGRPAPGWIVPAGA
ncbi:hypothetical protein [Phytoactinopolyspora halotolerans]|uniref:ATP-grasp domain-containing protein n=1 Tax=Phytoactinopolyspora halotolerans TaxID=1981512 RepID=A0A6L9S8P6_9ACTN|nr:hypothetical protein [Phytoactinopolyspora halotolerans]NEE01439.1 hypothetical protein [Phytoactinopolyspora halotolerans]